MQSSSTKTSHLPEAFLAPLFRLAAGPRLGPANHLAQGNLAAISDSAVECKLSSVTMTSHLTWGCAENNAEMASCRACKHFIKLSFRSQVGIITDKDDMFEQSLLNQC